MAQRARGPPALDERGIVGLYPDRWFNNVELVTAEKIGIETTTYATKHLQVLRRL